MKQTCCWTVEGSHYNTCNERSLFSGQYDKSVAFTLNIDAWAGSTVFLKYFVTYFGTWCCRARFRSGISAAVCCLSWPRGSLHPFRLQRTGRASRWSPTLRGPGPESRLDTPYRPVEGRSTAVAEIHWAGSPMVWDKAFIKIKLALVPETNMITRNNGRTHVHIHIWMYLPILHIAMNLIAMCDF